VLAGSVLTVWSRVENAVASLTGYAQFRLQIIRVKTSDDRKIIGCVIPSFCLNQISSLLQSMSTSTYMQNNISDSDCILVEEPIEKPNSNRNNPESNSDDLKNVLANKLDDFNTKNVFSFNLTNEKSFKNVSNQILNCDFT
jgi:hypothetical protein